MAHGKGNTRTLVRTWKVVELVGGFASLYSEICGKSIRVNSAFFEITIVFVCVASLRVLVRV
jgi:hypothetical protein